MVVLHKRKISHKLYYDKYVNPVNLTNFYRYFAVVLYFVAQIKADVLNFPFLPHRFANMLTLDRNDKAPRKRTKDKSILQTINVSDRMWFGYSIRRNIIIGSYLRLLNRKIAQNYISDLERCRFLAINVFFVCLFCVLYPIWMVFVCAIKRARAIAKATEQIQCMLHSTSDRMQELSHIVHVHHIPIKIKVLWIQRR